MRLIEIKQHEIDTMSRRAQKWADKQVNLPPQEASVDLNEVLSGYMEQRGLEHLGDGAFSVVYGRPGSNRVVKISHNRDICWFRYANWAMKQHNNPHVPIIHYMESYAITAQRTSYWGEAGRKLTIPIFFAIMERLEKFSEEAVNLKTDPHLLAYFNDQFGFYVDTAEMQKLMGGMTNPHAKMDKEGWHWMGSEVDEYADMYYTKLREIAKKAERHPFVKLFKTVEKKWQTCSGDLHTGNIMIRPKTGEIVIVDPIADTTSI